METLRDVLNNFLSKATLISGGTEPVIYLKNSEYIHAKYICTEDEKDFCMIGRNIYFKGFKLINIGNGS